MSSNHSPTVWLRNGWTSTPADRLGERAAWATVWSMWTRQLAPYRQVRAGDVVCMVERVRGVRTVTEVVPARRVVAEAYGSRRDAAVLLNRLTNRTLRARDLESDAYVQNGPAAGFLLAVTGPRVDRLDVPLPDGWAQDRCGWTVAPRDITQMVLGTGSRQVPA